MDGEFDVAVIGAGPAGAATARQLSQAGCRVLLLERSRFDAPRVGESLAPATQPLLAQLGVWQQFLALSPLPSYGTRSAWGSTELLDHSHLLSPYGCGWHLDRLAFDRMLADAAAAAGAQLRSGTICAGCDRSAGGPWELRLSEGGRRVPGTIRARALVDATGRTAHLGRYLGAERIVFDRLVAVGALFGRVDVTAEGYVLVEAIADGWWYSAPVAPGQMIAMLMTDSDICRRAGMASPNRWRELLAQAPATAARARGVAVWGPRVFSAVSQRLHRSEHDDPWVAVGDACLAVDPISGSGVVRALRSAQAATRATLALLEADPSQVLPAYESDGDIECSRYLQERALYYAVERRWEGSPFWSRRLRATIDSRAPAQAVAPAAEA
jgi:flavin-dependent dehydrogenase